MMREGSDGRKHARLSPSTADRWMTCPGSPYLCDQEPPTSSVYADEGTAAHTLAEWVFSQGVPSARAFLGRRIDVGFRTFEVDEEMAEAVDAYVLAVDTYTPEGSLVWTEMAVPIAHLTQEPDAEGTADRVVYTAEGELQVHDLKYGRGVAVDAEENLQLLTYGLGVYDALSLVHSITTVRLVIHQPRLDQISEWITTVERLEQHRADLQAASERVRDADEYARLHGVDDFWERVTLVVSEKGCRFCAAKATCPAFAKMVTATVRGAPAAADDFEDLTVETVQEGIKRLAEVPATAIARKLDAVDAIESWCEAVRAKALAILSAGGEVPRYKLVRGKKGARAWSDKAQAEAILKRFRLKTEEMYDLKLISPTTAEKLAAKAVLGPRQWKTLQELVYQPEGKLHVAPEHDPRPAVTVASAPEDFDDLTEEGSLA